MAGIKHISELYKKHGEKGLKEILNREVRITEKFDAYRFSFEKNAQTYKLFFYGKNGKTPINKIDRTISDLYEGAIEYIESIPYEIRKDLPLRHRFGFSWFPTKNPLNTDYERRPKNGLVLTDITIRDRKNDVTRDVNENEVYKRYAKILGVDYAEPLFSGKLDESIVNQLISIAKNEEEPTLLTESFDTKGYLNTIHPNIEAMIFESEDLLFKVSHKEEIVKSEKRSHMFDLLLMDIIEHIASFNILGIKCASARVDEAYVEAVSEIFNDYVEVRGKEYLESAMEKPKFLDKAGKFNTRLIKNPKTRMLVEKDRRYEYLLSVFLANFRKPKFASGLLNESTVNRFNSKIEELDKVIGDDYSFLEFSTIIKEEKEETIKPEKAEPDYAKAVHLLTKFFDPERNIEVGKEPVNVIVFNGGLLTNRILEEAERLKAANKNKCILIHAEDLHNKYFGADKDSVEKILAKFVVANEDLFIDYKIINRLMFANIINKLRPKYEPILIHIEYDPTSIQKELEGTEAIYSSPSGLMRSIKVAPIKDLRRKALLGSLEGDSYKDFCKLTPECVHPYWREIKNGFDKYTFK
jgi:hypothetical protein